MPNTDFQKATSIAYQSSVVLDDLLMAYGQIQGTIVAQFISQPFINRNYADNSVMERAGTVQVKRFISAISQAYGTARAADEANKLQNNGVDVKIDTDREIAEDMSQKDRLLYSVDGPQALLASRVGDFGISIGSELEYAYFIELADAATIIGNVIDLSSKSTISDKVTLLIETLEKVGIPTATENVKGVDRSEMIIFIAPEFFDELESEIQLLPNPLGGGVNARFFRRVRIEPALRQTVDISIQRRNSVAQPLVLGDSFDVRKKELSADYYSYLPYFYGTKSLTPDVTMIAALDESISV